MTDKSLETLKDTASQLGITYRSNVTAEALNKSIEDHYKNEEKKAKELAVVAEAAAKEAELLAVTPEDRKKQSKLNYRAYARKQEALARKTQVITIIDNDQRINNHTTTCTVTCSNNYFDLGTAILPLNVPVEVRQGHIDVLRGVRIPRHVKSPVDPTVSVLQMVPRYTIQVEQV